MAQQVFPTKSNLMATKRSLVLARQGYELMDRKRNILIREMMQNVEKVKMLRSEISKAYETGYYLLQQANVSSGVISHVANQIKVENGVDLTYRSVMGVELPSLRLEPTAPLNIYYGLDATNGTPDKAYLKFNEVKTLTVELAEVESSVFRLAEQIRKTQKRANALSNVQIPQFRTNIRYIGDVLDEKEREEFSRLKVIKAQKGSGTAESAEA